MNELVTKYNCEEYFDEYYLRGLFHPTECQELYAHQNFEQNDNCLIIGEVYDDHDCLICYRLNFQGIWGKSNYDGSYQKISDNLKELTKGWYQANSNYWGSMNSEIILPEIIKFYKTNMLRYNWDSQPYVDLLEVIIRQKFESDIFAKGFEGYLDISWSNGFNERPKTKMVSVYLDREKQSYMIFYKQNFFDYDVSAIVYDETQLSIIGRNIINWID